MLSFETVALINYWLAVGTVGMQIAILLAVIFLLLPQTRAKTLSFFGQYGLLIALAMAVGSSCLSLFYSNIVGYEPCNLCWWQRISIYPQIIILSVGLWLKDSKVVYYALPLLGAGLLFSLYQVSMQFGLVPGEFCVVRGVSCTKQYVFEFGYVTVPIMALTSFAVMIGSLIGYHYGKKV